MDIQTPTIITDPVFTGYLESVGEGLRAEATKTEIGRPEWWYLRDVLGSAWKPPQGSDMYMLIRLSYSLTPPNHHEIRDAQLSANLACHGAGSAPVAFDLFPREVTEESKTDVKVNVKPSLKLEELEASVGSVEATIHIPRVEPVMTTSGIGGPNPTWFFRSHRRHPIIGSRMVYAIVACPAAAAKMTIKVNLTATLKGQFGLWLLKIPPKAEAQLTRIIP
jgi:hypothetical protein